MKSGMILSSQFEVPSNEDKSQYARLYGLNERWYPNSTSLIPGFTIDLANLQNAPVYFQINFLRPKKLSYVIIQGWESAELFSQRFYLSYTNMKGVEAHYGETTPKVIHQNFADTICVQQKPAFKKLTCKKLQVEILIIRYRSSQAFFKMQK